SMDVEGAMDEGYPLEVTFPDIMGWELSGSALIANGPEGQQEGAKQFIDWLISESGQEALAVHHVQSMLDGIEDPRSNIPGITEIEWMEQDWEYLGENRDRLIDRFKDEI